MDVMLWRCMRSVHAERGLAPMGGVGKGANRAEGFMAGGWPHGGAVRPLHAWGGAGGQRAPARSPRERGALTRCGLGVRRDQVPPNRRMKLTRRRWSGSEAW